MSVYLPSELIPRDSDVSFPFWSDIVRTILAPAQGVDKPDLGAVTISKYRDIRQLPDIQELMGKHLSEPYSIVTYRHFVCDNSDLCFLVSFARVSGEPATWSTAVFAVFLRRRTRAPHWWVPW
jgi:hypothetical protein